VKRIVLGLSGALVLFLVGRAVVRALVSDETKIRWLIEDMREGFDETRMNPILVAFDETFRDETSGADRANVREALAYLFLTAKDPKTKEFPYRVEIGVPKLEVDSKTEPRTAECDLDARFFDLRAGEEEVAWEIAIQSSWTRGEYGWRIAGTRCETKSGRMLR
jgi:hypothetical protein